MIQFREFDTVVEAELAAGLLDSQGIRCEVRQSGFRQPQSGIWVWLAQEADFGAAAEILDEPPSPRRSGWSCPTCRTDNEAQFDACWSCGAARG